MNDADVADDVDDQITIPRQRFVPTRWGSRTLFRTVGGVMTSFPLVDEVCVMRPNGTVSHHLSITPEPREWDFGDGGRAVVR